MKHMTLVAFALALAACGPSNNNNQQQQAWGNGNAADSVQVCMDRNSGQRLPDSQCQQQANYNSDISPFVWFYLGSQMAVPAYYQPIPRYYGSFRPVAGYHYYHDYHPGGLTVIQRRTYVYPRTVVTTSRPVVVTPRPAPVVGSRLSQGSSAGTSAFHPVTVAPAYHAPVAAPVSAYRPSVSSGSAYRSSFGGGSSSYSSSRSFSSSSSSSGRRR